MRKKKDLKMGRVASQRLWVEYGTFLVTNHSHATVYHLVLFIVMLSIGL